jgi:hypothetical protein
VGVSQVNKGEYVRMFLEHVYAPILMHPITKVGKEAYDDPACTQPLSQVLPEHQQHSLLARMFGLAPQVLVILTWAGILAGSLFAFSSMKIGLEQQLVLPTGSYLKTYFDQQAELGEAGPPVYVVLQNVNYTDPKVGGVMLCCRTPGPLSQCVLRDPTRTRRPSPLSRPHRPRTPSRTSSTPWPHPPSLSGPSPTGWTRSTTGTRPPLPPTSR